MDELCRFAFWAIQPGTNVKYFIVLIRILEYRMKDMACQNLFVGTASLHNSAQFCYKGEYQVFMPQKIGKITVRWPHLIYFLYWWFPNYSCCSRIWMFHMNKRLLSAIFTLVDVLFPLYSQKLRMGRIWPAFTSFTSGPEQSSTVNGHYAGGTAGIPQTILIGTSECSCNGEF